jgi:hypothetical protein
LGLFSSQVTGTTQTIVLWALIILGIVIGALNVTRKESSKFLLVVLSLVVVSYVGSGILSIIPQIGNILSALLILFVPTTIIVALKSIFEIAKD